MPEICVLCNSKLESKAALQDHFRKHANREIDCRGRPVRIFKPIVGKLRSVKHSSRGLDSEPVIKTFSSNRFSIPSDMCTDDKESPHGETGPSAALQCIVCDVCGMVFICAAKAISHKWRAHPNQPSNFCCSHCGKQFPLKTILDHHVADQHNNNEPQKVVRCDECGEEFFNEPAKDYHAKVTHRRVESVLMPVATPPPSKKIRLNNAGEAESVYYCHLCGSEYILKFNLRKHLMMRHAKEDTTFGPETEIIRCTLCEAVFCNKKAYEVHNMYHQPNDMYVTSEEHRLKTVSRVDQDFDLRRVQIQMPKGVQALARQKSKRDWNSSFSKLESHTNFNAVVASGEVIRSGSKLLKLPSKGQGQTKPKILMKNQNK